MRRLAPTLILAVLALASAPGLAPAASIWSPLPSGTTQDISAVDLKSGLLLYATTGGKIFRSQTEELDAPGVQFTDIAWNEAGDRALATAKGGKVYRYNGATWALLSLANTTYPHSCSGVGPFARNATPTGDFNAVAWAGPNTAYVVGTDRGVVLKVEGAGVPMISDVSRRADGSCRADQGAGDQITSIEALSSQVIVMSTADFGKVLVTPDAFATPATVTAEAGVNCFGFKSRLAIDRTDPKRLWMSGACPGRGSFGFSEAADTFDIDLEYPNGDANAITSLQDVAAGGGSAVAVGKQGDIIVSRGGKQAYFQRADGVDAQVDWLTVDKDGAGLGVVAGAGGRLIFSTTADAISSPAPPVPVPLPLPLPDPPVQSNPLPTPQPTPPTPPSPRSKTKTKTKITTVSVAGGGKISLSAPRACVPAGGSFTARLSFKRAKRKGTKVVKVKKVDFSIGRKKQGRTDKKAPFTKRLSVKRLRAGATYRLRARATLKVRRGRSPRTSISTTFKVCG